MSEEQTDRLEGGTPFEIRVLRELSNLNNRLTGLEEKVDARLHDTRPIWESVLLRLDTIETRLDRMEARLDSIDARLERVDDKFDAVGSELLDVRTDIKTLKKRPPAA
jgi:tetrahydromethanopterin S-methyltransferase subunit G